MIYSENVRMRLWSTAFPVSKHLLKWRHDEISDYFMLCVYDSDGDIKW